MFICYYLWDVTNQTVCWGWATESDQGGMLNLSQSNKYIFKYTYYCQQSVTENTKTDVGKGPVHWVICRFSVMFLFLVIQVMWPGLAFIKTGEVVTSAIHFTRNLEKTPPRLKSVMERSFEMESYIWKLLQGSFSPKSPTLTNLISQWCGGAQSKQWVGLPLRNCYFMQCLCYKTSSHNFVVVVAIPIHGFICAS